MTPKMYWRDDINPAEGPHKVLLKRGEFVDGARGGRVVPYKIYHPVDHGPESMPVIIWSHGFGGNRDGASFLSRYIASHGYIIAHLTHHGTDSSLWEGKDGHPWDILRAVKISREITLERFKDVPFAVDQLIDWAADNPEVGAHMDFEALGMSGHSFGALSTQVAAGQLVPNTEEVLSSFREERFKAGIAYSPNPIDHLTDAPPEKIYSSINVPMLYMTGTEDASPLGGYGYEKRQVVYDHTGHAEKYWLVKEGGDHMVYAGSRGKLAANPLRETHEEIIKVTSLAFWEAQLKGDEVARAWFFNLKSYYSDDLKGFRASY